MLDSWLWFAIAVGATLLIAVVLTAAVTLVVRFVAKRKEWPQALISRARRPFRAVVLVMALWFAFSIAFPYAGEDGRNIADQLFTIVLIAASAWLLVGLVHFATDVTLGRHRLDVPDNRQARKIYTQTVIVRRLATAIIVIIAVGAILLTFPAVRTFGASLLASAGIASIVAGLAAQSVLANVFAGVQLAFSDALRVDDVVVVEGEWGRIGEITLSYVVVDIWDDRRLVLPSTYFTTKPFENWTRRGSALLGSVEIDADWRIAPARMRAHLEKVLAESELWDGRTGVLQITDAAGGFVRVRILVSAEDSPTLFDLRCNVREAMVTWMQREMPDGLPIQRVLVTEPSAHPAVDAGVSDEHETDGAGSGLFTGSADGAERAATFTRAIPVQKAPTNPDEALMDAPIDDAAPDGTPRVREDAPVR